MATVMARKADRPSDYFVCPHCGAEVRARAARCPECGSDAETGWSEGADKWGADIPTGYGEDDEFDYDEFVRREFGGGKRSRLGAAVCGVAVALLVLLLVLLLARR
jgi:RNA polymerase subunit RPABC4/transcription elongation factor Spt4